MFNFCSEYIIFEGNNTSFHFVNETHLEFTVFRSIEVAHKYLGGLPLVTLTADQQCGAVQKQTHLRKY